MEVKYTTEQQQVIDLRDRNILVSAAAGSGKTAVLVERIITRLTKDTHPINVDELLVLTFTKAAAAEMRERILSAIEKALSESPENEHLQRQATMIHHAQITTIHEFCLSVIREYFHEIDLDPSFRVGDETEMDLLAEDVVEQVLEEAYAEGKEEFHTFVECFASGTKDDELSKLILKLYESSNGYTNPKRWLDSCVEQYQVHTPKELENKPFIREIMSEVAQTLNDMKHIAEMAIEICESEGPIAYKNAFLKDLDILNGLLQATTYEEMYQALKREQIGNIGKNTDKSIPERTIKKVQNLHATIKKTIEGLQKKYFFQSIEKMQTDMLIAKGQIQVLVDLVKAFIDSFAAEKRNKNVIDFTDMEQFALRILTREEQGNLVPSEVAEHYQARFAEIMIDEYQDSNYVQEAIFSSVSKVSKGIHNVFMVGDVKQSIYRFRLARPELFMEKYHTYSIEESEKQRIDLHKNFRSRREVLDSTNYVFKQIMMDSFGGISYDDKAALHVGASYAEKEGNETEVLILDAPKIKADDQKELEVELIAKEIHRLMANHKVFDKKTNEYRNLCYKDIAILNRSALGWNDVATKVLNRAGIPTYAASKEGYYKTVEITTVLNYLRILNNPRQDIPFVAILTSMFARVSTEELAAVKSATDKKTMYEACCFYAEHGANDVLKRKLQKFLTTYETFRTCVPYTTIHELMWRIIDETGYGDYVSALANGKQRAANLSMLLQKAKDFENTSYKGLFNFVRYIDKLEKYSVDNGEANTTDENNDVVSLMTIHKSKGLEFPIVFVTGLGKKFNIKDSSAGVVIHSELGVGIDVIDPEKRVKSSTLLKSIIQQKNIDESKEEGMRVLYVAMTRAKEKMYLTGVVEDLEKELDKLTVLYNRKEWELPYQNVAGANRFFDWILPALYRNQCFEHILKTFEMNIPFASTLYQEDVPAKVHVITPEDMISEAAQEIWQNMITKEMLTAWDANCIYDEAMKEQIESQFGYVYPYDASQAVKQKISVSELKQKAYEDEEGAELYKEEEVIPLLPKFLQEEKGIRGAMRGSAYHKLLEILDWGKAYDKDSLILDIQAYQDQGLLSEEMAACIHVWDILKFLQTSTAERMKKAYLNQMCFMEQPFVLGMEAKRVYPESESDELVMIQGIIDAYFEEDGELVLLDYKTDRVEKEEELSQRYRTQLEYYAEALENLTGKKVKEKIIYSFALQKEIQL